MHAVATGASDACLGMRRTQEVGVGAGVATQAGLIHRLGGHLGKLLDLGDVTAAA